MLYIFMGICYKQYNKTKPETEEPSLFSIFYNIEFSILLSSIIQTRTIAHFSWDLFAFYFKDFFIALNFHTKQIQWGLGYAVDIEDVRDWEHIYTISCMVYFRI